MRRRRLLQKDARYFISAKINKGEEIFEVENIKKLFMEIVERSKKKFHFSIKNIVFRSNQIEFKIKPGKNESLSKIIQWILSVFAMRYNAIHKYEGHVWGGKYNSEIVK